MKKFYNVSTEIVEKVIKDTSEKDILSQVKNISQIPMEKSMDIFMETPMKKYTTEELLKLPGEIALKIIMKRSFIHRR